MGDLVDQAQRSSYQLSKAGTGRLRKLTREAGLSSENIVSRLAISASLREELPRDLHNFGPATGKEIRGLTLLGRRRSAAVLIALICQQADRKIEHDELRSLIRFHWERGLSALSREVDGKPVTSWMAQRIASNDEPQTTLSRDDVAKFIGREFGRWPIEVRRLVANAGHLDPDASVQLARDLASTAGRVHPGQRVSEAIALEVLRDKWRINRLGIDDTDRALLARIRDAPGRELPYHVFSMSDQTRLSFLQRIGLVSLGENARLEHLRDEELEAVWSLR